MIRHLYIHVPFCLRRCSYCDFAVQAVNAAPTTAWLEAVTAEIDLVTTEKSALSTIYVGGGTPSLIGGSGMRGLRDTLARYFTWDAGVEWTAEANPETFTEGVAIEWRAAGVDRVSLGAQSFDEHVLRWMGRMHGSDGTTRAVTAARAAGIDNLSVDLIFGLPGRLNRDWESDLSRVIDLGPEHVSLYGLTAEKNTPLGRWVAAGRESLADEDQYVAEYMLAVEQLTAAGFEHYEVSNFARPGFSSQHNYAYWQGVPYLGIGPGAHSFVPPVRWWNVRDWNEYAMRLGRGETPRDGEEIVNAQTASLERAWLGLRSRSGLQLSELGPSQQARVDQWQSAGLALIEGGVARLTSRGWLVLDRLVVELDF
ncbi:MAG: radical SAM family heme chaperone HemW [Gemmatimonadota bacterium]